MGQILTTKQKEVLEIYEKYLKPTLEKHTILQENLCLNCFIEEHPGHPEKKIEDFDVYGIDTAVCDKCLKTNDLINEFIYFSIKELKYNIKEDMYSVIPRIHEHEAKSD